MCYGSNISNGIARNIRHSLLFAIVLIIAVFNVILLIPFYLSYGNAFGIIISVMLFCLVKSGAGTINSLPACFLVMIAALMVQGPADNFFCHYYLLTAKAIPPTRDIVPYDGPFSGWAR